MTGGSERQGGVGGERQVSHSSEAPVVIRGARVVRPRSGRVETTDILLRRGRVEALETGLTAPRGTRQVDAAGRWLVPGWIDLQLNDFEGLSQKAPSPEQIRERARQVLRYQASRGVTGLILATLAAPMEELLTYLKALAALRNSPEGALDEVFLGALVEGTFMNPAHCGAHNPAWVLRPRGAVLDRLLDTGGVRLLNLAPEMSPDAIELIRHAAERGVIVGVGHAKPHAERLREAVDAGLRYAIHLGNGPTGSSLKAFQDGGMLEESLRNDDMIITLILDGCHVHPQLVRDWIARKEISRVIGVSDAAFATGVPSGEFEVMGIRGTRSADGRTLWVVRPEAGGAGSLGSKGTSDLSSDVGSLFGSAIGMGQVFENAINMFGTEMVGVYHRSHPAMPIDEALVAAAQITSLNPARLLGLDERGSIEPAERADVVLLDIQGAPGSWSVEVQETWLG